MRSFWVGVNEYHTVCSLPLQNGSSSAVVASAVLMQGPGKVAIRPVYPMTPHRGPAPRDCVGPGREPDSSDRHGRTYGADRDFAGPWVLMLSVNGNAPIT